MNFRLVSIHMKLLTRFMSQNCSWNNVFLSLQQGSPRSDFYTPCLSPIFHQDKTILSIKFTVRAHIRIFQSFRICIYFHPTFKIVPARTESPQLIWNCSQSKFSDFLAILTKILGLFHLFSDGRSHPIQKVYNEGTKAYIESYWKMPSKSKFGHFANKRAQQKD